MELQNTRLMLVYNADGGIISMLKDAIHKQVSPATYPCSLCALTYGAVSMRGEWRRFLKSLPMDVVFHHRDDFAAAYPGHDFALPAVLISEGGNGLRLLIPAEELDAMQDAAELIARLGERIASAGQHEPSTTAAAI